MIDVIIQLYIALAAVAIVAEHLTVFGGRPAALAPWGYMVGLHIVYVKMFLASRTNTLLPLVCHPRHFRGNKRGL